ncbi:transposable element tc1 transposase, putative, partial [Ixodes scapularis]
VWGSMSKDGLGPLVRIEGSFNAQCYCEILDNVLVPYILDGPFEVGCCLLQHDRSPVHTARSVSALLEDRAVRTLQWPPVGPDLNPIESVWGWMKGRL